MNEKSIFIVDDDLPAIKRAVKEKADEEGVSVTELMVRALCKHYKRKPPERSGRVARESSDSTALALEVPTWLWQAVHNESGAKLVSKKQIVLDVFRREFMVPKKKKAA